MTTLKKLLTTFRLMFSPFAKAQAPKPGSDADPIREMLFASQPLKVLLARAKLEDGPGPFRSMAEASKLADEGKQAEAMAKLRAVLETPPLETRVQLWVWNALRGLGTHPDPRSGHEALGVVLEMPTPGGYDTLAGYVDGTARYLNHSGKAIFSDQADPTIKRLCQTLVDSTIPAGNRAVPRTTLTLPKSGAQATLLTRSGIYVVTEPPGPVVNAGAALMLELIERAQAKSDPNPSVVLKIAVRADGIILVDGVATPFPDLPAKLAVLKEKNGVVWYYRANPTGEPPSIALEVVKTVIDIKCPLRLFSREDFSEPIGPDGKPVAGK